MQFSAQRNYRLRRKAAELHGDVDAYAARAAVATQHPPKVLLLGGDWFAYSPTAAAQVAFADGPFRRFLERLAAAEVPVAAIYGNVDRPAAVERVQDFERIGLLRLLTRDPYVLTTPGRPEDTAALIGYPLVPPTPFRIKDHERRDRATDRYGGPWPILLTGGIQLYASGLIPGGTVAVPAARAAMEPRLPLSEAVDIIADRADQT